MTEEVTGSSRAAVSPGGAPTPEQVAAIVGARLEHYLQRGVLRGVSRVSPGARRRSRAAPAQGRTASFRMVWHGGRTYELRVDAERGTLRLTGALSSVPVRADLDRELRRFVASRQSSARPDHRRLDPSRLGARCVNRKGEVSIVLEVLDGDWDHAAQKLVRLVDEIFQIFLADGRWYEYRVELLGLDPDRA